MKTIFISSVITFLCCINVMSQRDYSFNTVAGKIEISAPQGELNCFVTLGRKTIATYECDTAPTVLKQFKNIAPFDEVIVLQNAMLGNACDGTDIYFIGINKDASYDVSESIDYCGGPAPIVTAKAGRITVVKPGSKPNRGDGWIPKETYTYENGVIRQVKTSKRRQKN